MEIKKQDKFILNFYGGKQLRYGENSHQSAKAYLLEDANNSIINAPLLNGKEMSYNNYVDADCAAKVVSEIKSSQPAVAIIKHTNPCGFATGESVNQAIEMAWNGDTVSAFGGVIAANCKVNLEFASFLQDKFIEVLIAPEYDFEALDILKKKKSLRILEYQNKSSEVSYKFIDGGVLVQESDNQLFDKIKVVTNKQFEGSKIKLAEFAMMTCKHLKSNAIAICREYNKSQYQLIGMGCGQPNRIESAKLAINKAMTNIDNECDEDLNTFQFSQRFKNFVLASDAFFPFDDVVKEVAKYGIKYIIQPGGSVRDQDSIDTCDKLGVAMAFTRLRHFSH